MHNQNNGQPAKSAVHTSKNQPVSDPSEVYSYHEIQQLLEEHQIYQIELEHQNEELHRIHAELEEAIVRYTDLFDFAPIGYLTFNLNGEITEINLNAADLLGLERQRLIGKRVNQFIHPASAESYSRHITELAQYKKKTSSEISLKRSSMVDTSPIYVQMVSTIDSEHQIIRSAMVDITMRREAIARLESSQARINSIFQASPAGIGVVIDGKIAIVNDRICNMLGYKSSELVGKDLSVIYGSAEDYLQSTYEQIEMMRREGTGLAVTRLKHKAGYYIDVFLSSAFIKPGDEKGGITFTALDVSDQMKTELALSEAQAKFEMVASNAHDGMLLLKNDGSIDYFNQATVNLFSIPQNQHMAFSLMDLFAADENSEKLKFALNAYYNSDSGREIRQNFELTGLRSDGSLFPVELSLSSFRHETRNMLVAVIRDFTEHKLAQLKLTQAKEKAEESERLKSAFLANVSHEIRTPLNSILGFVSLMQDYETTEEERAEYFRMISGNGEVLLNLINDLIDLMKLESETMVLSPVTFDLEEFMNEIYEYLQNDLILKGKESEITAHLKLPERNHISQIVADKLRLRQVLVNLLHNAIKFTDKGSISIEASLTTLAKNGAPAIRFCVCDTGIGVPSDKLDYIFESFRQIEDPFLRKFGGAGLGLAIVKKITEASGGEVKLESKLGSGSSFYINLPLVHPKTHSKSGPNASENQEIVKFEGRTFLIVEDKLPNTLYLKSLLSKSKVNLLFANNGSEAVEIVRQNNSLELVLMDIQLPVMDGYTATRHIKQLKPGLPVIAQTAFASFDDREKVFNAGFDDFISKPINPRELLRKISQVLKLHENA